MLPNFMEVNTFQTVRDIAALDKQRQARKDQEKSAVFRLGLELSDCL